MELSEVGDDARQQLSQELFPHPETLAPAQTEDNTFSAADIFEIFGVTHAYRSNTTQQPTKGADGNVGVTSVLAPRNN
jgi:hypothetical protein